MSYTDFLESKRITVVPSGFTPAALNPMLFDFQRDVDCWALERGKAALFEDCGLGKSPQQLVWAEQVVHRYNKPVLILAPLAVSKQTIREGEKFGIEARLAKEQSDVTTPAIYVTNYEKLNHFNPSVFAGVVLDESSILKSFTGATRNQLIECFANTPMKLCCTATPAPNDFMELGNHSEFLGVLTRTEMLSTFFVHDGGDTSKWRLKGHAEEEYWKWICQWAVMLRQPSDLGYDNNGFVLPQLNYHHHVVKSEKAIDGFLFPVEAQTLTERRGARRASLNERVELCAALVNESVEPWLIWCDLNDEGDALAKLIPDAVQVAGRDKDSDKESRMFGFSDGHHRVLISKPSICGWGMNWQHCANVAFVGLSDSWEQWYQAIRRVWRFGQTREVNCHVITSEAEGAVVRNIQRKEADAARMAKEMVKHMSVYNTEAVKGTVRTADSYKTKVETGDGWEMHLGDCVEQIADVKDESVHYSIFSPPFISLYVYSALERDMGNARSDDEFYTHFQFLIKELHRVLLPGRLLSFHCMDIPAMKERDGYIGLKDFPGDLIRMFQAQGFIYHSRAAIWKDPLVEATRTKALGLMHKQVVKDSAMSRQGLPDYLITMRKPGDNSEPISRPKGFIEFIGDDEPKARKGDPVIRSRDIEKYQGMTSDDPVYSHQVWRRYASPVWMDINQSNTLQRESAREDADERHVCPLQLQVIERALELWTNANDVVLDPFAGIGSTGYVSLQHGRRFIGFELKESYFKQAVANLRAAETVTQTGLFAVAGEKR
jgi:DNA modification methylase